MNWSTKSISCRLCAHCWRALLPSAAARSSAPAPEAPDACNASFQPAQAPTATTLPSPGPRLTLTGRADWRSRQSQHQRGRLLALAQAQVTREVRSVEMPRLRQPDRRRCARGQPHHSWRAEQSFVYNRAAGGLTVSQLITDFGRTHNLVQERAIQRPGAAGKRARHRARHYARGRSDLLSGAHRAGRAEGGAADRGAAPGNVDQVGALTRQSSAPIST